MARAQELYERYLDRMVDDEAALQRARAVVDFDAAETQCPACGHTFAPRGVTACPDCGLCFR